MKQINLTLTFLLSFSIPLVLEAQRDAHSLIKEVADAYQTLSAYDIKTTYRMFRGFSGDHLTESYTGQVLKKGDFVKFSLLGSEIVQDDRTQLVIDHESRQVIYSELVEKGISNSPLNVSHYLKLFDKSSVYEKEGQIVCELATSMPSDQMPYGKVVFFVEKETYRMTRQVIYFSQMIPFVEENTSQRVMDTGRMEITFDYQNPSGSFASISDVLIFSEKNTPKLVNQYSTYQLINQAH